MRRKNYPLYEAENVEDLKALIARCANKYGNKTAFKYKLKNIAFQKTYNEFFNDVKHLSLALMNINLTNSNIAIIGENSYEWITSYFAIASSGNVVVPLDKELSHNQIINLLKESDCKAFIFASKFSKTAIAAKKILGNDFLIIDMFDSEEKEIIGFNTLIEKGCYLESLGNVAFNTFKIDNKTLAAIHYTSGTTGMSKGVMLTHKNILSDAVAALKNVHGYSNTVLILPIHHTFGLTVGVISMLHNGTCIYINNSMKRISSDLTTNKPDYLFLVPLYIETLYNNIWKTAKLSGKDRQLRTLCSISDMLLSIGIDIRKHLFKNVLDGFGGKLKLVICGGAPIDPKYIKGFRSFGVNVLNGYGITECSPIVAVNRNKYYRDGSVGTILPCCKIKISNPNEHGEGEILVQGDNVMKGYYKNLLETDKAFSNGWFKTGDIGRMDKDGFLYITGRSKNIIVLNNGKNIYPEELEMYIMNIPFVEETIVYSEKDDKNNEISLIAEVYINNSYTNEKNPLDIEKELNDKINELNKTLPYYKNISKVKIRESEFKKTSTRKIIRNVTN